jgi:uncharacterized protein with HEPN domain
MTEKGAKYLSDIIQAIELIDEFTKDINSFSNYSFDLKTQSAVERQSSIVGEAVNKYDNIESDEKLENARKIVGFRNRLVHAYDSIDVSIVWVIIKKYLPTLKQEAVIKFNSYN